MIRRSLLSFDTYTAKVIGRFPRSTERFFRLTGLVVRPGLWISVLLFTGVLLLVQDNHQLALFSFVSAFCIPISSLMKFVFRRQRPVTIYTESMKIKSYSFPSSHAFSAALGALACSVVLSVSFDGALMFIMLALLLAIVVGVSRVYVGAHYPSDVVGGIVIGSLVCFIIWLVILP